MIRRLIVPILLLTTAAVMSTKPTGLVNADGAPPAHTNGWPTCC